jgi:AbrB family looped-hinge helix DNA binding protein
MQSVITSKYQTTIPKAVRESMKLSVKDTLEWTIVNGKILVTPVKKKFLTYQNKIKIGKGDIRKDIERARSVRVERYK